MFFFLELESRTPLIYANQFDANSLEEQIVTPSDVTACINILQERPYSIENDSEKMSPTDSTDGKTSNLVSNLEGYLRKYENWSDWRFKMNIKTMITFKHGIPENKGKEGKEEYLKIMVESGNFLLP